jgi:hypothetical protein
MLRCQEGQVRLFLHAFGDHPLQRRQIEGDFPADRDPFTSSFTTTSTGYATCLLTQDLLNLADLFLHFTGYLFDFAFGCQLGIIAELPGYLFDLTLYFVKLAFCLVPCAGFHGILLLPAFLQA